MEDDLPNNVMVEMENLPTRKPTVSTTAKQLHQSGDPNTHKSTIFDLFNYDSDESIFPWRPRHPL